MGFNSGFKGLMAYPPLVLVVQGTGDRTDGDTTAAIVF